MKLRSLSLLILILALGAFTFLIDAFKELNITKEQAQESIVNSITSTSPTIPDMARKVAAANRVAILQSIGAFAKQYVKTVHFKNKYAEWWKSQEPTKPQTPEEKIAIRKGQEQETRKSQDESMATLKKQLAETKDPATKKMYQDIIEATTKALAATQSPEFKESMKSAEVLNLTMEKEQYKTDLEEYTKKMAEWNLQKDPTILIKTGLNKLLSETEGVDFTAKLITNEYGVKVFVKEEYEAKSGYWKQAYRAGKPTVDAARAMAKAWLTELK